MIQLTDAAHYSDTHTHQTIKAATQDNTVTVCYFCALEIGLFLLTVAYNRTQSFGNMATGTSNAGGGGMKNRDFWPTSQVISEIIQYRAVVTIKCERKTVSKLSIFDDLQ